MGCGGNDAPADFRNDIRVIRVKITERFPGRVGVQDFTRQRRIGGYGFRPACEGIKGELRARGMRVSQSLGHFKRLAEENGQGGGLEPLGGTARKAS